MKVIYLCSFLLSLVMAGDEKCLGISLQVGGSGGSYEVGALWGMYYALEALNQTDKMRYDAVSGVSVGSINSLWMSMFEKGDEKAMVDGLSDLWGNLHSKDIYQNWTIPYIPLRWRHGVYNNTALLNLLEGIFEEMKPVKKMLSVGTVDLNSGTF
jgi:predicted acylesterase/phospholipase RssA